MLKWLLERLRQFIRFEIAGDQDWERERKHSEIVQEAHERYGEVFERLGTRDPRARALPDDRE